MQPNPSLRYFITANSPRCRSLDRIGQSNAPGARCCPVRPSSSIGALFPTCLARKHFHLGSGPHTHTRTFGSFTTRAQTPRVLKHRLSLQYPPNLATKLHGVRFGLCSLGPNHCAITMSMNHWKPPIHRRPKLQPRHRVRSTDISARMCSPSTGPDQPTRFRTPQLHKGPLLA